MIARLLFLVVVGLVACGGELGSTVDASTPIDASAHDVAQEDVRGGDDAAAEQVDSPSSCDPDAGGDPSRWYCTQAHEWSICDPTTPTSGTGCLIHEACEHDASADE